MYSWPKMSGEYMKFSLSKEHRYFFQEKGYIQFEEYLSKERLEALEKSLGDALSRLKLTESLDKQYQLGRDLWRKDEEMCKWVAFHRFAELVGDVIGVHTLRLGFDQFFPGITSQLSKDFDKSASLESISCLKGIAGAIIIAIDTTFEEPSLESTEGIDPFPYKAGSVSIVGPQTVINWRSISKHHDQRFYMIVYAGKNGMYQLEPADPHTHDWKQLGYIFNEKLIEKHHPTVLK